MKRGTKILLAIFALMIAAIVSALFWESQRGPTFRAAEYESLDECLANIPGEWLPGSLEYIRASEACAWQHRDPQTSR